MKRSHIVLLLLGFVALAFVIPLLVILLNRPQLPPVTYPSANGYETLVGAGREVTGLPADYYETEDVAALQAFVESNSAAIGLIEQAATEEMMVSAVDSQSLEQQFDTVGHVRTAIRALHAKARIAEFEERPFDAAEIYLKMYRLAEGCDNNGLMIHILVALACKQQSIELLLGLTDQLSPDERQSVAEQLEAMGTDPLDMEAILDREAAALANDRGAATAMVLTWMMGDERAASMAQVKAQSQAVDVMRDSLLETLNEPATEEPRSE